VQFSRPLQSAALAFVIHQIADGESRSPVDVRPRLAQVISDDGKPKMWNRIANCCLDSLQGRLRRQNDRVCSRELDFRHLTEQIVEFVLIEFGGSGNLVDVADQTDFHAMKRLEADGPC